MPDSRVTWRETCRRLHRDRQRSRSYQASKFGYAPLTWFLDPGFVCVLLHRLSHLFWVRGPRLLGRFWMQLNSAMTGADIQPAADLGAGLLVPAPCGATISAKAGRDLTVMALAGLGGSIQDHDVGAGLGLPVIGDNCRANQWTGIQGSIRLGDGVTVEAGAGVLVDIAPGSRVVAAQPRLTTPAPATTDMHNAARPERACHHGNWRNTRADLTADIDRLLSEMSRYAAKQESRVARLSVALTNPMMAIFVYRLSHWLFLNRWRRSAVVLCHVNMLLHKLTIPPASCIGGGLLMPHLGGTVFSGSAGVNLTLYAEALCCPGTASVFTDTAASPILGEEVMLGGFAGVFGPVTIGDGVVFGPKTQTSVDVDAGVTVWSRMMRGSERKHDGMPDREKLPASAGTAPPEAALRTPNRNCFRAAWREMRQLLRQDRARLRSWGGEAHPRFPALTCVVLFRASHCFFSTGWLRFARWCWMWNVYLTGADLVPGSDLGGGLLVPYPAGVAVHCRAGNNLTLFALSGIGTALDPDGHLRPLDETPQLGDGVTLSPHSGVYGAITIGDATRLLPGCIVSHAVPGNTIVAPLPLAFRRRLPR